MTEMESPASHPERQRRQIYGRRVGVKLKPAQQRAMAELLPLRRFEVTAEDGLKPRELFAADIKSVWLEIGFGGGEHLAATAAAHPDIGIIGVEPFLNGVAKLMSVCQALDLPHVRVLIDDARLLLKALPDASLGRAFVLFPDPWPKLRHHKRRIVNPETVADFARVIEPGGELRLATDDRDYGQAMLATLLACEAFEWLAATADDWRLPWAGWPGTRYEAKAARAGRAPIYLRFRRRLANEL
ncbi:tRNA (guanine-N7-)-methyltransferase [Arboricoccus pini]|uniref:tRNA (guanine-N(7)-)-methyltransferase n=1 Tax=Arboricoccus pini TaxID=1963835 RepID=A0A212PYF8_9PROT|nr:tRNA (guanosine(46)-N7)-methyltransferase TrmB [Arboricoccus pini]SNB52082.1 tRNA (guanine-N7-)-methyltransferase [Arboricoccus pini]